MNMRNRVSIFVAALLLAGSSALAQVSVTDQFQATITVQADCQIISTNTLDFGTTGIITGNIDSSADITVHCTNLTPYTVALDDGSTAGGTTATRLMTNGSANVAYQMFSDAARTTNWGDTVGSMVAGTGNGAVQTHTVWGRVPVQATPEPDTYTDLVTVTVTF